MKKVCIKCSESREVNMFAKKRRLKTGEQRHHTHCKLCQSDINRDNYNADVEYFKKKGTASTLKRRVKTHLFFIEYFKTHPCVDCGEDDPLVLDFDHVRGAKKCGISKLKSGNSSMSVMLDEVAKCEVRCANCHRKQTAIRRGGILINLLANPSFYDGIL